MAWVTPRTWTATVVTVPQLNEQIRDNMNHLKTAVDANGLPQVIGIVGVSGSDYAATSTSQLIIVFTANTITMPAAAGRSGHAITVKSIGVIVPIAAQAGEQFDYIPATSAQVKLYPYDSLTFTSDGGVNWWIS